MIPFLLIMITFPLIVTFLLKSKYIVPVVGLAIVNLVLFVIEYLHFQRPEQQCMSSVQYKVGAISCDQSVVASSWLLITAIILVAVVMWYLGFKPKDTVSVLATSNVTRKTLTVAGWLIVLFVFLTFFGVIFTLSQI